MEIIAVANQKGGVAKTTTTYNLAASKALSGANVLMVDLDPQASLSISCNVVEEKDNICRLFEQNVNEDMTSECAVNIEVKGLEDKLFLIPSDIDLAYIETQLISRRNAAVQLKKALKTIDKYFDYCFIDCPPQLGLLLTNALTAANKVIIPVKTDYLSYKGLKALMQSINDIISGDGDFSLNPELEIMGIIATMFEKNINDQKDILEILERDYKLLGVVKKSADAYRSIIDGKPTVLSNPSSDIAKSYKGIAELI